MPTNAAQHEIVNLLKTFFLFAPKFLLVCVYFTNGARDLFFFQGGPETPKGWTPPALENETISSDLLNNNNKKTQKKPSPTVITENFGHLTSVVLGDRSFLRSRDWACVPLWTPPPPPPALSIHCYGRPGNTEVLFFFFLR